MSKWIELNNMVTRQVNGMLQLEKDKEAVHSYFVDHINNKMKFFHDIPEKVKYLIEEGYYNPRVFQMYDMNEVYALYNYVYGKKFRFQSYMSAFKFYNNYAMKTFDGELYLERYEDRIVVNALEGANGNLKLAKELAEAFISQEYQPATPTFQNAGKLDAGRKVSCFLLQMPDSTEGISYINEAVSQLSRFGGGVAVNLSILRGEDEEIKNIAGASSSVVKTAKIIEAIQGKFNQLGMREGAVAIYINAFHSDSKALLDTKKINADEAERLKTLSLGLIMPSKIYELAELDMDWYSFYPYSVYKKYGVHLDDMNMDEWYDTLLDDEDVRKKPMGNARHFLEDIGRKQLESGYPYLLNRDNANKVHLLKDIGDIKMSNLCVEIIQLQSHSDIQSHKGVDTFGYDISCNLGSLNISNVMKNKSLEKVVQVAIQALSIVSETTSIEEVPSVKKANEAFHSVGLGAMNYHGYLAEMGIPYISKESFDFANVFFATVRYYALKQSMEIAKVKGAFKHFEKSEYAKGTALTKYLEKEYVPVTDKVKVLFDGIKLPTTEDWKKLNDDIMKHGIFNAYQLAIAPTGSISYVQNATPSVMPITEKIETRTYGDSTTIYPMPNLSPKTMWFYQEAYTMDMLDVIDLISIIQEHVDQSISFTLFVDADEITTGDLAKYYIYAHKRNIKTIYYAKIKNKSDVEGCVSCAV